MAIYYLEGGGKLLPSFGILWFTTLWFELLFLDKPVLYTYIRWELSR